VCCRRCLSLGNVVSDESASCFTKCGAFASSERPGEPSVYVCPYAARRRLTGFRTTNNPLSSTRTQFLSLIGKGRNKQILGFVPGNQKRLCGEAYLSFVLCSQVLRKLQKKENLYSAPRLVSRRSAIRFRATRLFHSRYPNRSYVFRPIFIALGADCPASVDNTHSALQGTCFRQYVAALFNAGVESKCVRGCLRLSVVILLVISVAWSITLQKKIVIQGAIVAATDTGSAPPLLFCASQKFVCHGCRFRQVRSRFGFCDV